jgi:SAM-dependent methyltransferase
MGLKRVSLSSKSTPPVIDYEGSGYRTDFWEGQGREYEDASERLALRTLLPGQGGRVAEIGAGFGRLADLYLGYEQIVLLDYSRTMLQDAVRRWGHDPRFVFVAGDIYQLPLATGILNALVMVRVAHHLTDMIQALTQIRRVLHWQSVAVLEYANKRNMKAMVRWLLGRQRWSPFDLTPVEFVKLNFDFHPVWMRERLHEVGLAIKRQFAVSHFRVPWLKQKIPAAKLAKLDSLLFEIGGRFPLSPSVFVQVEARDIHNRDNSEECLEDMARLFRCPCCFQEGEFILEMKEVLLCAECGARFARKSGVWDFKERLM